MPGSQAQRWMLKCIGVLRPEHKVQQQRCGGGGRRQASGVNRFEWTTCDGWTGARLYTLRLHQVTSDGAAVELIGCALPRQVICQSMNLLQI